jgi:hypothetical protein
MKVLERPVTHGSEITPQLELCEINSGRHPVLGVGLLH